MILMPMSCEKCHSFVHTSRSHLLHFSSAFVWRFSPFCDAWWATAVMLGLCDTYRYKTAHLGGGENALKHDSLSRSLVYEVISLAHGTGRSLNYLAKIFVLNFEKGNNLGTPQGSAHPKNSVSTIFNICQLFSTFFNTCRNLGRIPLSPRSEFCWILLNFAESAWRLPWGLPRAVPPKQFQIWTGHTTTMTSGAGWCHDLWACCSLVTMNQLSIVISITMPAASICKWA